MEPLFLPSPSNPREAPKHPRPLQKPRECGVFVLGEGRRGRANRDRPQGARLAQNTFVGAYSLGARGVATGTVPFARRAGGAFVPCEENAIAASPNPHCVVQTGTPLPSRPRVPRRASGTPANALRRANGDGPRCPRLRVLSLEPARLFCASAGT